MRIRLHPQPTHTHRPPPPRPGVRTTRAGATVLHGVLALIKMAEAAVHMNRALGGHFTSKRLSYAPPRPDQIEEIRRYCGDVYPTVR